jgi:hypothetical protein
VDPAGEIAKLGQRLAQLLQRVGDERLRRCAARPRLCPSQRQRGRDELLLCAVV